MMRRRVLIADDHSVVREGLASLITRKADMTVIGEAPNGREAVDLWKQHKPDVTLLDLRMPELDGVGAIKEIRGKDANARPRLRCWRSCTSASRSESTTVMAPKASSSQKPRTRKSGASVTNQPRTGRREGRWCRPAGAVGRRCRSHRR